jgi:hypothetical protein
MSLLIDPRTNSSSSTIAINGAFDNRPSGTRAKPLHTGASNGVAQACELD